MRSGRKNAVVGIWQDVETGRDPEYNTPIRVATLWKADLFCEALPRRGREVEVDGQVQAETYMKFTFEYFDVEGILPTMYVIHEAVRWEIKGILPDLALKEYIAVDTVATPIPTERA